MYNSPVATNTTISSGSSRSAYGPLPTKKRKKDDDFQTLIEETISKVKGLFSNGKLKTATGK